MKDVEHDRAAARQERSAAEHMGRKTPAATIAEMLVAAERMREAASLSRVGDALAAFTITMLDAGEQIARSAGEMARKIAVATDPKYALEDRRIRLGGMAHEAQRWPEEWRSTVCSALLCSITPCPSERHDLRCTCPCHRRKR
jgi:hypothetical protein